MKKTEKEKCVLCQKNEATQKHHLLYEPEEIVIPVCVSCHLKLHNHGVGLGSGHSKGFGLQPIKIISSHFTYADEDGIIKSLENDEELGELNCINGCGKQWHFFTEASSDKLFIRCGKCGWDCEVMRIG